MTKLTDHQKKLGYYTVGSQEYYSKLDACIAGTRQNIHPKWHYNDQVWQSIDWTVEPPIDILELYKMRARQIREQYDYVVIYYSGGSDSQTVVESFIDAQCHIDEVVTAWNRTYDQDFVARKEITDARNIEAEFELTTRPGLDWIKQVSPKTKITYHDVSVDIIDCFKGYDGEEWLSEIIEHLNPQAIGRYSAPKAKNQKILLDRGMRTALVYGVDKPKVCIKDGQYCLYFVDVIPNPFKGVTINHDYTNLYPEFFYWGPDIPEIMVKQAHLIKRWFQQNPALEPVLAWPNFSWANRNTYETVTRSVVYPKWDLRRYQAEKSQFTVYCEWDNWFFKHFKGTVPYHNWKKGIDYVEANIDKKYLNYTYDNVFNGFVGMINGFYPLDRLA